MSGGAAVDVSEAGAIVFDVGTNTTRVGYAGEDSPKAEIFTTAGVISDPEEAMEVDDQKVVVPTDRTYHFDPQHVLPEVNKNMLNPLKDGMIEDWDLFEQLITLLYSKHITGKSEQHPVLMTEPAWNTTEKREKLTELMFEKYNLPALFLSKGAVLSAFAHGKSTGLVVNSGVTQTTAVPVQDGFVIQKGIVRSPIASDFLTGQCENLVKEWGVETVPEYMIKSKGEVLTADATPDYTLKELPELTDNYKDYMKKLLFRDFQKNVLQVSENPYDKTHLDTLPSVSYGFPHGHIQSVTSERFRIAEGLFDTSHLTIPEDVDSTTCLSVPSVINTSISLCDQDVRAGLYGSVIIVGGTTLIDGFVDRLTQELTQKTPNNMRLKVVSNNEERGRRFSSWIGGSILGSLSAFPQMWVSKQEFQETGKSIVEKKCP